MLFKLQKYDLAVHYIKSKELHVTETCSQTYLLDVPPTDNDEEDIEFTAHAVD